MALLILHRISIFCSGVWLLLLLWIHQPSNLASTLLLMSVCVLIMAYLLSLKLEQPRSEYVIGAYWIGLTLIVGAFFLLPPRNDRLWKPEVAQLMSYRFIDGQVEIQNVRNFIWKAGKAEQIRWETRRYAIENIQSVDLIISHFAPGPIAHVFISFGFKDGQHLAFSLEVRQEQHEEFSVLGGFFRQYELALVVGDENDLIYSRTNMRDEDVYIYPIQMQPIEMQMLFLEYLNKANRLNHHPRWYNTLFSNCTTILFDLTEHAMGNVNRDYRALLPGLLPNYLYDAGQLDRRYSLKQWRERAHVNPKTQHLSQSPEQSGVNFSQLIRQPTCPAGTCLAPAQHVP